MSENEKDIIVVVGTLDQGQKTAIIGYCDMSNFSPFFASDFIDLQSKATSENLVGSVKGVITLSDQLESNHREGTILQLRRDEDDSIVEEIAIDTAEMGSAEFTKISIFLFSKRNTNKH